MHRENRSKDIIQVSMFKQSFSKLLLHSEGIMLGERTLIPTELRPEVLAALHEGHLDRDSIWCANVKLFLNFSYASTFIVWS